MAFSLSSLVGKIATTAKSVVSTFATGVKAIASGEITPFKATKPGQIQLSITEPFRAASTGVITAKQMTSTGEVKPVTVALSKSQTTGLKAITTAAKVTGVAAAATSVVAAAPLVATKALTPGYWATQPSPVANIAPITEVISKPVQPLSLITPISNISNMASPDYSSLISAGLGAVAGAVAGKGTSNVIAVGRKYIIKQTSTGKIYAVSRIPRRRYAPRSRGTKFEKLMEMGMLMTMMRANGGH